MELGTRYLKCKQHKELSGAFSPAPAGAAGFFCPLGGADGVTTMLTPSPVLAAAVTAADATAAATDGTAGATGLPTAGGARGLFAAAGARGVTGAAAVAPEAKDVCEGQVL